MNTTTPDPYYILIEEGKPPKVSHTNPLNHPSELVNKRLLMVDGLEIQEFFFIGMMAGWKTIK